MPVPGEGPATLRSRLVSLRGFDTEGMMIAADVVEASRSDPRSRRCSPIRRSRPSISCFAEPGCHAAWVEHVLVGSPPAV